jgi:hypothetical protein
LAKRETKKSSMRKTTTAPVSHAFDVEFCCSGLPTGAD